MRSIKAFGLSVAAAALSFSSPSSAADPIVSSGTLTGATNVNVNGTLYNVEFVDGTCVGLFGGCDSASDFTFQSSSDAQAAAQALLDQVFLDGVSGQFDSQPQLTLGCTLDDCFADVPYGLDGSTVLLWSAFNLPGSDEVRDDYEVSTTTDTTDVHDYVFALFTPAAVPEPSTWAMMLLGFGAMGIAIRRHRRTAITRRQIA
jgi:hypothetical protein